MYKYSILFIILFFTIKINGQINIGSNKLSSESVSLEFGEGKRGLILPWVDINLMNNIESGTLIFDINDNKIKYRKKTEWFDLSVDNSGISDTSIQDSKLENPESGVIIGNETSNNPSGILVLSDSDRAMILPKVENPHLNIINPSPGMIVYDISIHELAVFNGSVWTFWKTE